MNDLVERLQKEQEVAIDISSDREKSLLRASFLEYAHPHITFTKTGTTLGVPMNQSASDLSGADFEKMTGKVKVVGDFVLNYNKVRIHASVDLASGKGLGRLEYLGDFDPAERKTAS
jgi:hypothetical protein